ncbi:endoribonuclease MazF [bacterium]|nr:endoribonuclease MazF [bacterium]
MKKDRGYIPERGDAIWITLDPQAGHEQSGRRPAVVLSPEAYNGKVGLVILCPITNQVKGYPFEVRIPPGLPVEGVILADQVKNLDWEIRKAELICQLSRSTIAEVLEKIEVLLSFED